MIKSFPVFTFLTRVHPEATRAQVSFFFSFSAFSEHYNTQHPNIGEISLHQHRHDGKPWVNIYSLMDWLYKYTKPLMRTSLSPTNTGGSHGETAKLCEVTKASKNGHMCGELELLKNATLLHYTSLMPI